MDMLTFATVAAGIMFMFLGGMARFRGDTQSAIYYAVQACAFLLLAEW